MNGELFDPPGIVRSIDALAELAGRINAEHQAAETALRAGLQHAKTAGDLLIEAKKHCRHGEWLPWLKANVRFSERTARRYVTIASQWEELTNRTHVTDLSYRDALAVLSSAEPETNPLETDNSLAQQDEKAAIEFLLTESKVNGGLTSEQLEELGAAIHNYARIMEDNELRIGNWLIECKEICVQLGDDWIEWLKKEVPEMSSGEAQGYMRKAKQRRWNRYRQTR
jgi:hypothetical protein